MVNGSDLSGCLFLCAILGSKRNNYPIRWHDDAIDQVGLHELGTNPGQSVKNETNERPGRPPKFSGTDR